MRLLVQRVNMCSCTIDGKVHSEIKNGLLVYVAFENNDDFFKIDKSILKLSKLRIFTDSNDKLNLSVKDINGEVIVISSFSLYGDAKEGNRPSFTRSLGYNDAKPLYDYFVLKAEEEFKAKSGVFGADMKIASVNDGPVSIIIDF